LAKSTKCISRDRNRNSRISIIIFLRYISNHQAAICQNKGIAVVTGSSSGIGFETSTLLAKSGFYTYATVRKLEGEGSYQVNKIAKKGKLPLEVVQLDVRSDKSVTTTINSIVKKNNRIDIIVNNAGYALGGALEETPMDEIRKQFETNLFGAVRVMQAAIPVMRKRKSGKIINLASMGGRISIPLSAFYHGSKFALEGVSESLQYELASFGIKIILIEPGAVGSNFWKSIKIAKKTNSPNSPYAQLAANVSKTFKKIEENAMHLSEVAKTVLDAVTSDDPQLRYVVGNDATKTLEARKNMSDMDFGNLIKDQFKIQ
jgi:NAD(P)-dependent dehydrogenase (short-subunit alcohol dehydrogenase family)